MRGAERIWPPSGARAQRGRMERGAGCAARSAFGRRAEPERSEGGWSEAQRSGAKWRGRGLGQRNTKKHFSAMHNHFPPCKLKHQALQATVAAIAQLVEQLIRNQ